MQCFALKCWNLKCDGFLNIGSGIQEIMTTVTTISNKNEYDNTNNTTKWRFFFPPADDAFSGYTDETEDRSKI